MTDEKWAGEAGKAGKAAEAIINPVVGRQQAGKVLQGEMCSKQSGRDGVGVMDLQQQSCHLSNNLREISRQA